MVQWDQNTQTSVGVTFLQATLLVTIGENWFGTPSAAASSPLCSSWNIETWVSWDLLVIQILAHILEGNNDSYHPLSLV